MVLIGDAPVFLTRSDLLNCFRGIGLLHHDLACGRQFDAAEMADFILQNMLATPRVYISLTWTPLLDDGMF